MRDLSPEQRDEMRALALAARSAGRPTESRAAEIEHRTLARYVIGLLDALDRAEIVAEAGMDALAELAAHVGVDVYWDSEGMPGMTMRGTLERERDEYADVLRFIATKRASHVSVHGRYGDHCYLGGCDGGCPGCIAREVLVRHDAWDTP